MTLDQDESVSRLERIIALIDNLDRLKSNPNPTERQLTIERMHEELAAARNPGTPNSH